MRSIHRDSKSGYSQIVSLFDAQDKGKVGNIGSSIRSIVDNFSITISQYDNLMKRLEKTKFTGDYHKKIDDRKDAEFALIAALSKPGLIALINRKKGYEIVKFIIFLVKNEWITEKEGLKYFKQRKNIEFITNAIWDIVAKYALENNIPERYVNKFIEEEKKQRVTLFNSFKGSNRFLPFIKEMQGLDTLTILQKLLLYIDGKRLTPEQALFIYGKISNIKQPTTRDFNLFMSQLNVGIRYPARFIGLFGLDDLVESSQAPLFIEFLKNSKKEPWEVLRKIIEAVAIDVIKPNEAVLFWTVYYQNTTKKLTTENINFFKSFVKSRHVNPAVLDAILKVPKRKSDNKPKKETATPTTAPPKKTAVKPMEESEKTKLPAVLTPAPDVITSGGGITNTAKPKVPIIPPNDVSIKNEEEKPKVLIIPPNTEKETTSPEKKKSKFWIWAGVCALGIWFLSSSEKEAKKTTKQKVEL